MLAGAIAALAGWLLAIRTSGATANLGIGLLFNAFAAVVIGGVSLKGGVGALPGVYAGVLLLSAINTAINLMGLPATLHPGDPRPAGARRGAARHLQAAIRQQTRMTGPSCSGKTRPRHRRRTRHRQGPSRCALPRKAPMLVLADIASPSRRHATAAELGVRLHRHRHLETRRRRSRRGAARSSSFGRLDILVQNAGIYPWQLIEQTSLEDWDRVMAREPARLLHRRPRRASCR